MTARDLTEFYRECEERLDKAAIMTLDRQYPSSYDTSIQPVATLRTAHAVQLIVAKTLAALPAPP